MVTQTKVREYALAAKEWIYVWGANAQTITENLMEQLYTLYGSSTYNRAYYQDKRNGNEGKTAADCSGFMYPLSGSDNTADGYYRACIEKGKIDSLPKDKVCLVFKQRTDGYMNHIGIYLGDGTVAEMASSKLNYQHRNLAANNWTHWGLPKWIDYSESFGGAPVRKAEWKKDEKGWWYQYEDGTWPMSEWKYLEWEGKKNWYYFDEHGYMLSDCLLKIGDEIFALGADGAMLETKAELKLNERGAIAIPFISR